MKGSSCQEIVVAVSGSCFRPAVMTERISIRRQGLRRSKRESMERKTGQKYKYDRDGEEREEVDEISFRLGAMFYRDAVDPPPTQPRMPPKAR